MFIAALLIAIAGAPENAPAEERLMRLLQATHGVGEETSPGTAAEARAICENFERYGPLIDRWLDPQLFSVSEDPLMRMRVANAASLAAGCGSEGLDVLVPRLKQAGALRDAKLGELMTAKDTSAIALRRQVEALLDLERVGLLQLTALGSDRLVEAMVARVRTETQLSTEIVRYFSAVAPKHPGVRSALEVLHKETRWNALRVRIDGYFKIP